jgi:hypothetical protein
MASTVPTGKTKAPSKAAAVARSTRVAKPKAASEASTALRLPFEHIIWRDSHYVAPTGILRSALFAATAKGARRVLKDEQVANLDGFELRFTGETFDMHDEDVWMLMLRNARDHGMGPKVHFTLRSMLRDLSWDVCGKSAERLRASFNRLVSSTVRIRRGKVEFTGHLVDEVVANTLNEEYFSYRLSPSMAKLFGPEQHTYLDREHRKQIKGTLTKWLHGFIESNPGGFPVTVDSIWSLSGSTASQRYIFVRTLRSALAELQAIGVVERWRIEHNEIFISIAQNALRMKMVQQVALTAR